VQEIEKMGIRRADQRIRDFMRGVNALLGKQSSITSNGLLLNISEVGKSYSTECTIMDSTVDILCTVECQH
jgi:hypothetical protein